MKIAIIEDDRSYQTLLKELTGGNPNWEMEFFSDSEEFGKSDLHKFDVIISDYQLPSVNGRELLKSIQAKTQAELFLMSAISDIFKEEDILNDNINGLISKMNVQDVIDQIKYCEVKIRINRLSETENDKFNEIASNGYTVEMRKDSAIVKVHSLLGEPSKKKILAQLDKAGINKIVVVFPEKKSLSSAYLGLLASIFNSIKGRKGWMVFWNATGSRLIDDQLKDCRLDQIFRSVRTLDEALEYLS